MHSIKFRQDVPYSERFQMIATTEGGLIFDKHWYFDFLITVCGNEEFFLKNTTEIIWKMNTTEDKEFVILKNTTEINWKMDIPGD